MKGTARNEADWVGDVGSEEVAAAKAYRENHVREEADAERQGKGKKVVGGKTSMSTMKATKEIFTKLTPANLSRLLNSRFDLDRDRALNSGTFSDPITSTAPTTTAEEGASEQQVNESGFALNSGRIEYISTFRAGPGKRIAIPVRIEPKVFYANERTSACYRYMVYTLFIDFDAISDSARVG
jgi:hypothetical protein